MKRAVAMLRSFSIRARMWGTTGLVLAMFALVGAVGLFGGGQIQSLSTSFVAGSLRDVETIANVRLHLSQVRMFEKQMVIEYEDSAAVLKHREAWGREIAATKAALAAMAGGGAEPQVIGLAKEADARLDEYAKRSQTVLNNIQNGSYDNARVADVMLAKAKAEVALAEKQVDEAAKVVSARGVVTQGELQRTMRDVMVVFVATVGLVVVLIVPLTALNSRSITEPLAHAAQVAQGIAAGDLSQPVLTGGRDEIGALLGALHRMQASLRKVVGEVHESSLSIQNSSAEVASGNSDLSSRTEQAAGSLQQTASSMAQLTGTVRQSADAAGQAKQLAATAARVAQRGGEVVAQVVSTMDDINTSSRKIGDIIGTIDGIAFQTNILALNAAVEAARAGEQGRGFAVVASEVRSLAQRSAEAAREIKTLIGASVDKVEAGSRQVLEAGSTMSEIVASVQRVSDIVGDISAAAVEQSGGIGRVNGAVAALDAVTQQNAALVEQSAAAAESLKEQASRLGGLVGTFRLQPA
ncbi:MAG TPA: methyl-accepting chemotaxis protein [Rubrivivax sp.]|nr:methyl-accepting chemotaxis protein [Rubrivivax sp.]